MESPRRVGLAQWRGALLLTLGLGAHLLAGCAAGGAAGSRPQSSAAAPQLSPELCARVVTDQPPATERERLARVRVGLGVGYMREGVLEIALQELEQALQLDPQLADAWSAMALLRSELRQSERADQAFRRALELAPSKPELHNNYGAFLCERGRYAQADAHFRCALEHPLYPTPALAYGNAGECALRAGDSARALADLGTALQLDPRQPKTLRLLAEAEHEAGQPRRALGYLQRYAHTAGHNTQSLQLGVAIADALGDSDLRASYELQLRSRSPDSAAP